MGKMSLNLPPLIKFQTILFLIGLTIANVSFAEDDEKPQASNSNLLELIATLDARVQQLEEQITSKEVEENWYICTGKIKNGLLFPTASTAGFGLKHTFDTLASQSDRNVVYVWQDGDNFLQTGEHVPVTDPNAICDKIAAEVR